MTLLGLLLGLSALILGAEFLVRGASKLALTVGISPLVVGLTVVAYGTSSPEVAVSIQSAMSGRTDIVVGNVVGRNIFNVLFILGASALITPLLVNQQLIRQEVPIMVGAPLLVSALGWDGLSRIDGLILLGALAVYTAFWSCRVVVRRGSSRNCPARRGTPDRTGTRGRRFRSRWWSLG